MIDTEAIAAEPLDLDELIYGLQVGTLRDAGVEPDEGMLAALGSERESLLVAGLQAQVTWLRAFFKGNEQHLAAALAACC